MAHTTPRPRPHVHPIPAAETIPALAAASDMAIRLSVSMLGPQGRPALRGHPFAPPALDTDLRDTMAAARGAGPAAPFLDAFVSLADEIGGQTERDVADGTKRTVLTAAALVKAACPFLAAGGAPAALQAALVRERATLSGILETLPATRPAADRRAWEEVARTALPAEPRIAASLAELLEEVGPEGIIDVVESLETDSRVEVSAGMTLPVGWGSPWLAPAQASELELEDVFLCLYASPLERLEPLAEVLGAAAAAGHPVLVLAEEVGDAALGAFCANVAAGHLRGSIARAPGFGRRLHGTLHDLAAWSGGEVFRPEAGPFGAEARDRMGRVRSVGITRTRTRMVGGGGTRTALDSRIRLVRTEAAEATSPFDRETAATRLARLTSAAAIIHVGDPSESLRRARACRTRRALAAARAARTEGVVPGGEVRTLALARALKARPCLPDPAARAARVALVSALEAPFRALARSAGSAPGPVMDDAACRAGEALNSEVFDVVERQWRPWPAAGLSDPGGEMPARVERALATASLMLGAGGVLRRSDQEEGQSPWR